MASSVEICSREVEGLQQPFAVAVRVETPQAELAGLGEGVRKSSASATS